MKMNKNSIIITLVVAVVVGAGSFWGGMQFQKSQRPSFANGQFRSFNGQGRGGRTANGNFNGFGRPISGEIISQDDSSITVKMQDGSTKIILLSDKTAINTTNQAKKTDLKTGVTVRVLGTTNSDGSVTAQDIQLNPQRMPMLQPTKTQ